jgi:basic membrane protein A
VSGKRRGAWMVALLLVGTAAILAASLGAQARAQKQIRIGYIATAPVTAGDWEPANYAGFKAMVAKLHAKASVQDSVPYASTVPVLRRMAQANDIIFLDSSGFADAVLKVAPSFPKVWFIVISYLATNNGLKNVAAESINWNELGFVMGTIGGYASPNHTFGQVNSVPIPAFTHWAGGAQQAAQTLFKKSNFQQIWINTFFDPAKGKQGALALISKGANVLFASADTAGDGVVKAVKEQHKLIVMPYIDQSAKAPKNVITSVTVNWTGAYNNIGTLFAAGKLTNKIFPLTFENGGLNVITPFKNVPASVQTNVLSVIQKIKSGKIKVNPTLQLSP